MNLTNERAFELLMQAFKDNPELDSASVLVLWGDTVRDYDSKQLAAISRPIPRYYTLVHGKDIPQSSDDGRQWFAYSPDERLMIGVEDIADFAKQRGLSLPSLMEVLQGKEREYNGYRVWFQLGSSSVEYKAPRDISEDDFRDTSYKPKQVAPYSTPIDPSPKTWTKG